MGIADVAGFYTKRNLHALAALRHAIVQVAEGRVREALLFAFTACVNRASKRYQLERQTTDQRDDRHDVHFFVAIRMERAEPFQKKSSRCATVLQDATGRKCESRSLPIVCYRSPLHPGPVGRFGIYGSTVRFEHLLCRQFLALGCLGWGPKRTRQTEIVVNQRRPRAAGGKDLELYGDLMARAFSESARVMRHGGRAVLAFSNTSDRVWTEIQDALSDAGT